MHLDDLQWGDTDGAALLAEVMRPPLAPPVLLIAAFRDEQLEKNAFLRLLFQLAKQPGLVCREIKLEPLSAVESAILAERLLAESNSGSSSVAAVARESGGNPFFLFSLAASLKEGAALGKRDERAAGGVVLDDLLWQRAQMLPADARSLLEAVAVAGSPIAQICAFRAAGLSGRDPKVTAILRNGLLARSAGTAESDEIDTYHDRIRESLVARLPEDTRRGYHVRLAAALVEFGSDDADRLAYHYELAGAPAPAGRYYLEAASRAAQVLAFDKAAALYTERRWSWAIGRRSSATKCASAWHRAWPTQGAAWPRQESSRKSRARRRPKNRSSWRGARHSTIAPAGMWKRGTPCRAARPGPLRHHPAEDEADLDSYAAGRSLAFAFARVGFSRTQRSRSPEPPAGQDRRRARDRRGARHGGSCAGDERSPARNPVGAEGR